MKRWLPWIIGIGALWWWGRMKDVDALARTIWGEARGEGIQGMQAVANVIMNRVSAGRYFSGTVYFTCHYPNAFSCWNEGDPNRDQCLTVGDADPQFLDALSLAAQAMRGTLPDLTDGATFYYAAGSPQPAWAREPTAVQTARIGNHLFYRGVF